ncbi:outer envelope pore protein 37, chloroplastic [Humulus lupulus]|uniref:outer envelope pore protein 37, chloroplastic n=1 Tax=Humulus lupulus TaxID=3486 RepID=UPI002B400C94|nr:outer envelope pore protein 37, chloroplastic [Humulus lupulus]
MADLAMAPPPPLEAAPPAAPLPLPPPPPAPASAPAPAPASSLFSFPKRPAIRVTSELDSDSSIFSNKVSCKLLDSLAKVKLSFKNDRKGQLFQPQLAFISKHLSIHYDLEDRNALLRGSFDLAPGLQLRATHDVKAQEGEIAMVTRLAEPNYALELSSPVPTIGLPRATFKFPRGQVSLEERVEREEEEETHRVLSINGIVKGHLLNGICTAQYADEELILRYSYKDEQMSFIPAISLPSNALSFAFKRRFGPSDKLSYWYNFDANNWSAVYKHTYGRDLKFKAGYDSEVRLGWASLWVGEEGGKAKAAPLKMKIQFMLQVPQDDIKSSALMFRLKKRWDI